MKNANFDENPKRRKFSQLLKGNHGMSTSMKIVRQPSQAEIFDTYYIY